MVIIILCIFLIISFDYLNFIFFCSYLSWLDLGCGYLVILFVIIVFIFRIIIFWRKLLGIIGFNYRLPTDNWPFCINFYPARDRVTKAVIALLGNTLIARALRENVLWLRPGWECPPWPFALGKAVRDLNPGRVGLLFLFRIIVCYYYWCDHYGKFFHA